MYESTSSIAKFLPCIIIKFNDRHNSGINVFSSWHGAGSCLKYDIVVGNMCCWRDSSLHPGVECVVSIIVNNYVAYSLLTHRNNPSPQMVGHVWHNQHHIDKTSV